MTGDVQRENRRAEREHIECTRRCATPEGVTLTPVPAPRHAWADVIVCPYEDCGTAFLVQRVEATDG